MQTKPEPASLAEQFPGLPVTLAMFGETQRLAVNAAQLHASLLIGTEFRKWIKVRIEKGGFTEGREYIFPAAAPDAISRPGVIPRVMQKSIMLTIPVALEIVAHTTNAQSSILTNYLRTHSYAQPDFGFDRTDTTGNAKVQAIVEKAKPPVSETKPIAEFETVEVIQGTIGGVKCLVVDGRELWAKLGVGRDFTNWIKGRISEYEFVEGTDFDIGSDLGNPSQEVFAKSGENSKNGRPRENYRLSLSTAKEFSMVERTPQGRQARLYFIDCERKLTNAMLTSAAAAAQIRQPSPAQLEDEADQDATALADSDILCKLARMKADRTWLLAMRQYGASLLLSRDEKASEGIALAIQARLAKQLLREIEKFDIGIFEEPTHSEVLTMISQWTPPSDD